MEGNNRNNKETPREIKSLISDLANKDGLIRMNARQKLVEKGSSSIDYLAELLESPKDIQRWEAVKALGQIGDPVAIPLLINALEDDDSDVRWLAAEGLIQFGTDSLKPILEELMDRYHSVFLREGAHHVIHNLGLARIKNQIDPLLAALKDEEMIDEIPLLSENILKSLEE